jgi:CelD/BcsL family acetyltransferase involved in cellulose biosynthesis
MSNPSTTNSQTHGASAGYSVERVVNETDLNLLESDWNRLSESTAPRNVFATFGWYAAWTRHYSERERGDRFRPAVFVFRRNGAVVGIAPFVQRVTSQFGIRVRRLEFVSIHADYNQLVIGEDRANLSMALLEYLARIPEQWDAIDLRDLSDGEDEAGLVTTALARAGLLYRVSVEKHPCPYMAIDGNAEQQVARLSGHVRRVLRKRRALAEEEGARVRIIEHPEQEPELLKMMIELERKKHTRSEFPPFIAPHEDVFRGLIENLGSRNLLCVALLERGTEAIAFQLSFRCGNALWDYNKAHDHAYSRLAPGTLLLLAMFDYGFAGGFKEYDFLRGEEDYKRLWSSNCRNRLRLLIWNDRVTSRLRKAIYYDVKPAVYRAIGRQGEW